MAMRLVRWLAWSVGILFLIGTLLQLVDFFNLYKTPPDIPESLNMVEFRLAVQDYRVAVWPIFLLGNLATGIGFMAVTALGLALAGHAASDNSNRVGIAAALGMAGIFGAVAQLLIIGVTQPTIDNAYCDCGFKETEIVSQIWAQQLAESASRWLTNAALVLAAIGVVAVSRAFRDRMPAPWDIFSWLTAIGIVAAVAIPYLQINPDLDIWVLVAVAGVMVPIWSIWLGASFRAGDELEPEEA
jgi:MFS family permease